MYPSPLRRVKRAHAANQMKRVQGGRCAASTCCRAKQEMLAVYSPTLPSINWTRQGLSVYPSAAQRECGCSEIAIIAMFGKRYFAANHMKRVQRANGSLAQVWGRAAPNGLPAENAAKPIWSRKNALPPRRRLRSPFPPFSAFPRPFVLRRDRHKETYTPEVNQPSSITAPTIRERTNGDLDPRRNRNATSRKPFCLALCGKQQA